MSATLRIVLENGYPTGAPSVHLRDVRGLDDGRQATVLDRLQRAIEEHGGGGAPILALLCEEAFEALTELNHPDGDCPFCLTPIAPDGDRDGDENENGDSSSTFMKLMSCYHCFHTSCFGEWWRWRLAAVEESDGMEDRNIPSDRRRRLSNPYTYAPCVACQSMMKTSNTL